MIQENKFSRSTVAFWMVFALLVFLNWLIFKPILGPLVFGAILAGSFFPVFEKIKGQFRLGSNFAAAVTCFLIFVLVFLPTVYLAIKLSSESLRLYQSVADAVSEKGVSDFLFGYGVFAEFVRSSFKPFDVEFNPEFVNTKVLPLFENTSIWLLGVFNNWLSDFFSFCFDFIIMLLVIFGLFVEGENLKTFVFKLSPLPGLWEQRIVDKFNQMNQVTLVCNGLGGVLQGGFAIIGFAAAGISSSLSLWFTIMSFLAFIPLVGISFVYIPTCVYFFVVGKTWTGALLFLYCSVVSLVVEQWFKPKFIGQRVGIRSLVVLLYIIGGMSVFGMAGIFYGPLICTMFLTVVGMYYEEYALE